MGATDLCADGGSLTDAVHGILWLAGINRPRALLLQSGARRQRSAVVVRQLDQGLKRGECDLL